mmetsp:Transcript_6916/g.15119  ORF Transcript_6916/g.15119 Transcript_6916/m.15119 type:complete len:86 (-) Transcript_6916:798-1055(-)
MLIQACLTEFISPFKVLTVVAPREATSDFAPPRAEKSRAKAQKIVETVSKSDVNPPFVSFNRKETGWKSVTTASQTEEKAGLSAE